MVQYERRLTRDVMQYVVECYVGKGYFKVRGQRRPMRIFIWSEDNKAWKGNMRAFYLHLCRMYDWTPTRNGHTNVGAALHKHDLLAFSRSKRTGMYNGIENSGTHQRPKQVELPSAVARPKADGTVRVFDLTERLLG